MVNASLEQFKNDELQVITAFLTCHWQPQGITVRTSLKNNCLRVVLESEQATDEQEMIQWIRENFSSANLSNISIIKFYGQQIGDDIPAWSFDLELVNQPVVETFSTNTALNSKNDIQCAKCGSAQIMATKKGFGVGKAAVGAVLLGPVGLIGGMIDSNHILLSCIKCGNQWEPSKIVSRNEVAIEHKVTIGKGRKRGAKERILTCFSILIFLGGFGAALIAIGVSTNVNFIGGAGMFAIAVAIALAFETLFKNGNITGSCPHCGRPFVVTDTREESNKCLFCHKVVYIWGNEFHSTYSGQYYAKNKSANDDG
jgi:DNA-directed RNA polymerase subunit M/transcription elongation factor TFIIS